MAGDRLYGPNASKNLAMLNPEQQELFHWFTAKLTNTRDCIRYGSMLQAVACYMPNISYWSAVAVVKKIAETPNFEQTMAAQEAAAAQIMNKPSEA